MSEPASAGGKPSLPGLGLVLRRVLRTSSWTKLSRPAVAGRNLAEMSLVPNPGVLPEYRKTITCDMVIYRQL